MTYLSKKINIDENLTLDSNDKKLIVVRGEKAVTSDPFFILAIEDQTEWISTKSLTIEQARSLVAYFNAHIILAENE